VDLNINWFKFITNWDNILNGIRHMIDGFINSNETNKITMNWEGFSSLEDPKKGNVLSMNNPGQGGAQQGGANPGGNVALGQGFQYDPVTGQYLIQDPNNTAAAPFNSPGTKQPYGRHLANALQHDWNSRRPTSQITASVLRPNITLIFSLLAVIPTVLLGIYPGPMLDTIHYLVSTLIYSFDFGTISCDAPRAWGLYFQNSASPHMEGLVEFYADIMFYLQDIVLAATSVIGTKEPGIVIDVGNHVATYAKWVLLLGVAQIFRQLPVPNLYIQFELIMVKDGNTSKFCLIDLNSPRGYNLWLYFLLHNNVTRHYVSWNGQRWYAVMSKTIPPYFYPGGFSPRLLDYYYSTIVDNDRINLYAPVTHSIFPGPNLWWYSLLCQNYDVRTSNGLHNYERDILPMDLMIATEHGTHNTGRCILPLKVYKWTMKIDEGNVLENC